MTSARYAGAVLLGVCSGMVAACGGGQATRTRLSSAPQPLRPEPAGRLPGRHYVAGCSDPRVTGGLHPDYKRESVVAGPLAVYPAASVFPRLRPYDFVPQSPSAHVLRFAGFDAAVTVAVGARVTVVIPRQEQKYLAFLFDDTRYSDANRGYTVAEGDSAVTFPGCYRPFTQYRGGFVVTRPLCARLLVYGRQESRAEHMTISFGARACKSQ
jgi:hypothetical protein